MNENLSKLLDVIAGSVKAYMAEGLAPVLVRLKVLEERAPVNGKDGADGKSVSAQEVADLVKQATAEIIQSIPVPKDGKDGADAKSIDPAEVQAMVRREVEAIPMPRDGKDADSEAIAAEVLAKVTKAFDAIPIPKDGEPGQDGKSIDPAEVEVMVRRHVEQIPRPIDGKDAPPIDHAKIVAEVVALVPNARDGIDGKSVSIDELAPLIELAARKAIETIPLPKDGKDAPPIEYAKVAADFAALIPKPRDGIDGKSVEREEVLEMVRRAVEAIPAPKDGADGADADPSVIRAEVVKAVAEIPHPKDGIDGKNASPVDVESIVREVVARVPTPKDGKSITLEDVQPIIKAIETELERKADQAIQKAIDKIPPPIAGKDGENGLDGRHGEDGKNAADIVVLDGIDTERKYQRGVYASFRGGMICSYRATDPIGEGDIAKAGWQVVMNGIDTESEQVVDGGRFVEKTTRYTNGKQFVRKQKFMSVLDQGVYKSGASYLEGDAVTYAKSLWIAQKDTTNPPGNGSPDWRLAVKRGADGKDFTREMLEAGEGA